MPEWFLNLDGGILLWLQEAVRNAVLTPLFTLYTHLGDSGLMWIALSVLLLCFKKTRKAGAAGLMALLLSLMFTNGILKHLVERPRPWLTVEGLTPLIAEHDPNSFPSGHTSASFAAASAWCRTLPRRWMGVTAVVLAALMGFSRLYVGVHFPSDVLAGVLVGLFCGIPGADGQIVPYSLLRWGQDIYKGFTGMNEIMVLSMLIGGLGELIRYHGGIAWLLARVDGLARRLAGKSGGKGSSRVGESCIALLASLADICTANNTVAIILTGGLAREIALKNGIDPRRSASLLDIFSCVFQGLIPWAAQLLLAGSLAKISPLEITINNWYCMLLAVAGILAIILGLPRIKARSTEA